MIEKYLNVKTGQDLLDLGIIPKDSSSHLALITKLRLEALRDNVLTGIDEQTLGSWLPAIVEQEVRGDITDVRQIKSKTKVGMTVTGRRVYDGKQITGLEGIVRKVSFDSYKTDSVEVEWSQNIGGSTLGGICQPGYGYEVPLEYIKLTNILLNPTYSLAGGIVADKDLGHRVRFTQEYKGKMQDNNGYNIDFTIPSNEKGKLVNQRDQFIVIQLDNKIQGQGNRQNYTMPTANMYGILEVSSLGQLEPGNKAEEVRKQVLQDFFPKTVLEMERAERVIKGLLMGKDMVLYGPPGGGKSNTAKDISTLAKHQGLIFRVENEHCHANCNPFSIFDETFAATVPPCPDCMEKYDSEFTKTGRFNRPKPVDVRVIPARYGSGNGMLFVEGTMSINRMHLAGFSIPVMEQDTQSLLLEILHSQNGNHKTQTPPAKTKKTQDFHPGVLIRSNNGILHLDEMDKLRTQALDEFLEALNSGRVQPEGLRYPYPAHSLIVGTANDNSKFSMALNDRMLLLAIRYPEDRDVSYDITRKGYHQEKGTYTDVTIPPTHTLPPIGLRAIPMPVIIERALDAFYMKFRNEYTGSGKNEVSGSNRSKFDALDAARAQLLIDQIFYDDTPQIALAKYAISGVQFAICSRVQETNREAGQKAKTDVINWVAQEFPKLITEEEGTWWCRTYKHIAIAKTQIPEMAENFKQEITNYEKENPQITMANAYAQVQYARQNPDNRPKQLAKIKYPFMNYMFDQQPGFSKINQSQLTELITYFVNSRKNSPCKMENI